MIPDLPHECPRDHPVAWTLSAQLQSVDGAIGLDEAVTHYRRSRAARRAGRQATRAVTALAITVTCLSGGMAAAYATSLPRPVQRVAHHLLARIGVPAPVEGTTAAGTRATSAHRAAPAPVRGDAGEPRHLTHPQLAAGRTRVPTGTVIQLDATIAEHRAGVDLRLVRLDGEGRWRLDGWARTGPGGAATFVVRVSANSEFVVQRFDGTVPLGSAAVFVDVQPSVRATVSSHGRSWRVAVSAAGVSAGDQLLIERRATHRVTVVGRARFDRHGRATVSVASPPRGASYVVLVPATDRHGSAELRLRHHERRRA